MKEPLLWFVLIGGLLFSADQLRAPDAIIVNDAVRNQIANLWQTQMGEQPSARELESLVHHWVREEVFYREALRLGLDREDTIIRRRLVQKLGFLAREVDEESVTPEEIQTWYQEQIAAYTQPVRYSLSQIYFSDADQYGSLKELLADDGKWTELGEISMLPRRLNNKSEREVASTFGTEFTAQLNKLIEGQWIGPITSTFGYHLVSGWRHLVKVVTSFTVAHSITLGLSAFNIVSVSQSPVEAMIALSIILLAAEVLRKDSSLIYQKPWLITFVFGLLHGIGFAGALAEIGLPQASAAMALFLFNVGIEVAQLSIIAVVLALTVAATRTGLKLTQPVVTLPVYLIGGVSCYWFIDRSLTVIG